MAQPKKIKKQIKKYQSALKRIVKKVKAKKTVRAKKTGKPAKKIEIKSNMIIAGVIEKYPEMIKIFYDYGITCVGCFLASSETIEQGISAHGIDVKKFLEDLNREVNNSL